jgi:hypothetical protein
MTSSIDGRTEFGGVVNRDAGFADVFMSSF